MKQTHQGHMMFCSNMTNAEYFAANGTLSAERIEELLAKEATLPSIEDAKIYIKEAFYPFPAEDFLSGVINDVAELIKSVRGSNKDAAKALFANLEDIQMTTFYAVDAQASELKEALKSLGEI